MAIAPTCRCKILPASARWKLIPNGFHIRPTGRKFVLLQFLLLASHRYRDHLLPLLHDELEEETRGRGDEETYVRHVSEVDSKEARRQGRKGRGKVGFESQRMWKREMSRLVMGLAMDTKPYEANL